MLRPASRLPHQSFPDRKRYSSCRIRSSSFGLCLASRPVRGVSTTTLAGLGWPTRSRAFAFTAFVAENRPGLRFVTTCFPS